MAPTPHVKIVKHFTYRGSTVKWSNSYHFNGGTPADNTHWDTLFDNIVNAEKLILPASVQIEEALGYAVGSSVPVHTKNYTTNGTLGLGAADKQAPGDAAAMVRFATTARTAKNHPVYLFNWYHGAIIDTASGPDALTFNQGAAIDTYATAWIAGFSDGTNTYVRAGPNGATAVSRLTSPWVRHRDFRD